MIEDGSIEIVSIKSPILRKVEPSADLYKSISEINSSLPFGALVIEDTAGKGGKSGGKNTGVLFLKHSLLAQTLDKEEIEVGVGTMAVIADNLDDELQKEFGGQKAIDWFSDFCGHDLNESVLQQIKTDLKDTKFDSLVEYTIKGKPGITTAADVIDVVLGSAESQAVAYRDIVQRFALAMYNEINRMCSKF